MRNQQTHIIRENVFYPEIEPRCNDSRRSDKSDWEKVAMCITGTGRRQPVCDQLQVKTGACQPESRVDCPRDKSWLAQPAFPHEKKDRPFKRHAGDFSTKDENNLCVHPEKRLRSSSFTFRPSQSSSDSDHRALEKRVRSSSFTLLTSFPPNQPVLKNNVFMPATLLQGPGSSGDAGNAPSWTVIRPATLQPPPMTVRRDVEKTEAAAVCTKQDTKINVDRRCAPASNADQPKSSPGSVCTSGIATRMQPLRQMLMPHKYNVDFVFGENMERRVLSPKRPTVSQTGASKRDIPTPRGSCNRNWPYQQRRTPTSLIESAAAFTARPKLKYELDRVDVVTGEESERNVLQVNCKLFVFAKENQSWTERGCGYLRLNDTASDGSGPFRSRLVTCRSRLMESAWWGSLGSVTAEHSC
ncbi:ran-binding protein 3-like isoform 2-T3 [Anomaloglossus baeobatrachus]|uniref:ran-binding protein 3-like isoform X2 n=1 Tax=Anomaloglossus baeobatrachus TaxID=238106 RepID=UPI003F4FF5D3